MAGGGPRWASAVALLITALLFSGCTVIDPSSDPPPGVRPTKFAATPQPLEPDETPTPTPTGSTTSTSPTSSPTTSPATSATQAPFRNRARVTDPSGDAGLQAPDYSDLVSVVIESDGRNVRVTIDLAGAFPTPLATGEVIGIGVDFYKDAETGESDYQLFADGGDEGWFAYLQTPTGFVEYPGEFRLGGGRIVFEIPLDSIGGLSSRATSTFLDWSKPGTVVNSAANDVAPNSGRAEIKP